MDSLPIDSILSDFLNAFKTTNNFIVLATPGAGKTTRLAPALIREKIIPANKKILMLQPRRLAAKAIAARIADENNWKLGASEVGYHVRFEKSLSKDTQLVIMTEGILARKLLEDPELNDVACVILDEFHERSIHSDLAIALLKELQSAYRPDLKIVVMSATLDSKSIENYLPAAKLFKAEAQAHELKLIYQAKPDRRDRVKWLEEQVLDALEILSTQHQDTLEDILVFLPGVGEIKKVAERIKSQTKFRHYQVLELHGSLSLNEQSQALKKPLKAQNAQTQRIILSTNIAETSLTVPGVNAVIDSGLVKISRWDLAKNFSKLELSRISLSSAKQRAGRAAREKAGIAYRLWSIEEEQSFKSFDEAEFLRADLTPTILCLAAWGISDFENFNWFEKPSPSKINFSVKQLQDIGALDNNKLLTLLGQELQKIPLTPRLALALVEAKLNKQEEKISLALSLLSEKDPVLNTELFSKNYFNENNDRECDLENRISALQDIAKGINPASLGMDTSLSKRCLTLADELRRMSSGIQLENFKHLKRLETSDLSCLLWNSYSDRLCRRKSNESPNALMVGGRGVLINSKSDVQKAEFFLALDISDTSNSKESKVNLATSLSKEQIKMLSGNNLVFKNSFDIDENSLKIQQQRTLSFRDLVIEGPFPVESKTELNEETLGPITQHYLEGWDLFSRRIPELFNFEIRILYAQKYCSELEIPSLSDELKRYLIVSAIQQAQKDSIDAFDPHTFIQALYPQPSLLKLDAHVPSKIRVPSGRDMKLHYSEDLVNVKCQVKLQELFGLAESPTILRGKIQIVFDLLSPAQSPVQTTKDLSSFWKNAYPALRTQLKIRYPRHPWPEDPWTAQATHKTKKRM